MRQLILLCLLFSTIVSCDNDWKIDAREMIQQDIADQVMALIADKSCNGASDCAAIAWGINVCGTAEDYLVFAPSQVDVDQLEALVADYNQLDHEINDLNEAVGIDCSLLLIEPKMECNQNVCTSLGERYAIIN